MNCTTRWWAVGLLLALLLVSLIAGAPLLSASRVPDGYDTAFHFWRAVEAERLLREGVLVPRWAPGMAWGYGYPLFIFQGALSAQAAALLHLLGLPWPAALNSVYFIGLAGSALALYILARALWGEGGGWGTALIFLFIPYHLYVVYYRGSLSETLAWVFPPLVLWGVTRWGEGYRRGLWGGCLALAALAATHPVSFYLFVPLFGVWVLAEAFGAEKGRRAVVFWRGVGLCVVGAGLGAFAWAPGLLERSWVQMERATSAWVFTYNQNFLSWEHLLCLPRHADPALLNDWPARGLGLLFVLVALLGLVTWPGRDRRSRWRLSVLLFAFSGFILLSMEISRPLWDALPFLSGVQFPWRFLAPAALPLALLGGVVADQRRARRGAWWVACGGILLLGAVTVLHWGWLYPSSGQLPVDASPAGMVTWERATDTVGTTASRELLPRDVARWPAWESPVTQATLAGTMPSRLDALPAEANVVVLAQRSTASTVRVTTPYPFEARYLAFYYPGWQVQIDGVPVAVQVEAETGLFTFTVPAGDHTLEVRFAETPQRQALNILSVVSLVALAGWGWKKKSPAEKTSAELPVCVEPSVVICCLAVALMLVLLRFVAAEARPVLWRSTRLQADGTLRGVEQPAQVNFGGRALLLGYDLPEAFAADAAPEVTLYWRALNPERRDWCVGLVFVGADGTRWPPVDLRAGRWARTPPPLTEWPAEGYARMDYNVDVLPGMPPGDYTLALSLFDWETLEPASVLGADSNPVGPEFVLGQVRVLPPSRAPDVAGLGVPEDARVQRCGALGLWSMTADRAQAAPGDVVALRWVWEALDAMPVSAMATVSLRDAAGAVVRTWYLPPTASWWPTDLWRPGDRWIGQPILRLPGSVESGDYVLRVGLPGCADMAEVALRIVAPERRWDVPAGFTATDVAFEEVIRLAGYDMDVLSVAPGDSLTVALAWQALAEMETSYRVFVHLVGAEGQVLAQSDGEPAGWTRPTTGWAVGEVVVDERVVAIPGDTVPGEYEIRVGLYVLDGPRLLTASGEDAVVLPVDGRQ